MALAAAQQLIGTASSLDNATDGGQPVDRQHQPDREQVQFRIFADQPDDRGSDEHGRGAVVLRHGGGCLREHRAAEARTGPRRSSFRSISRADAPLLFWAILSVGQSRKTSIAAQALAGISAPLCIACAIEPFVVAAVNASDTTNFGFGDPTAGNLYTFAFECSGTPPPTALRGHGDFLRHPEPLRRRQCQSRREPAIVSRRRRRPDRLHRSQPHRIRRPHRVRRRERSERADLGEHQPQPVHGGGAGRGDRRAVRLVFPVRQRQPAGRLHHRCDRFRRPLGRLPARHRRGHGADGCLHGLPGQRPPRDHGDGGGHAARRPSPAP